MRLEFLPWDDRLAVLSLVYDIFGPIEDGHPFDQRIIEALYIANPDLAVSVSSAEDILVKLVRGEELRPEEELLVRKFLYLAPHEMFRKKVLAQYEKFKEVVHEVLPALEEVVKRAHGADVLKEKIYVVPSFLPEQTGNMSGGGFGDVAVSVRFPIFGPVERTSMDAVVRMFAHELLHVFHNRDREFDALLKEIRERYCLPAHEAHTETLTNIVWWRAGKAKKMFEKYYKPKWKELVEFEERYRNVVKEWWEKGGDLKEMVREAFL